MYKKKIAIVSGVGIPANYSGYETLIENISESLSEKFDLYVYCSSKAYKTKLKTYKGAKLIYLPLKANGIQSIVYDLWSVFHAIFKLKIRSILILGVGIGAFIPILRILSPRTNFIVHLDGLEWKRTKWNSFIRTYLKFNEKMAGNFAHHLIADNKGIEEYILDEYKNTSSFIQYGSSKLESPIKELVFNKFELPELFDLSICRIVPENNTEIILNCYSKSGRNIFFVGNWFDSKFGNYLFEKFNQYDNIYLINKVYNKERLAVLKNSCSRYIHGHSVGGTNPSLVEAIHHNIPIISFDINFNRYTTFNKSKYFKNAEELLALIVSEISEKERKNTQELTLLAQEHYTWDIIGEKYKEVFSEY